MEEEKKKKRNKNESHYVMRVHIVYEVNLLHKSHYTK